MYASWTIKLQHELVVVIKVIANKCNWIIVKVSANLMSKFYELSPCSSG